MIEIKSANTVELKKQFVDLPYKLYKNAEYWVPMFYEDAKKIAEGKGSQIFANGEHEIYLAFKDNEPVGRICVGTEDVLNKKKKIQSRLFRPF